MIVVPNQLYSFHYTQVPGLERIYELARQHSYAPEGVDDRYFEDLPADDRLVARRQTLAGMPDEERILQQEYELSQSKGDHSTDKPPRDVEGPHHRQVLEKFQGQEPPAPQTSGGELPRRQMKHRVASGYVKLDERKQRLAELTAAVSQFFDATCRCQGDYWYPRGGFRDWHTNKYDKSGWRLYIVDVDVPQKSYFRIKSPTTNEIVTLWDRPGTFNFFLIDSSRLLWHCIGAEQANRWSKGFVIPDTWLDTIVAKLQPPE